MPLFAKKAPPVSPWWTISHSASDSVDLSVQQGVSAAANSIDVDAKLLRREIARGRYARAADAFDWKGYESKLAKELEARTMKAAEKSAAATARRLGVPFDSVDLQAQVRARARSTARQMAKESRNAMKESMRRIHRQVGESAKDTAELAKKMAGLNRQQANSVASRLAGMSDATAAQRSRETQRLIKRGRKNRASLVARHEGLTAAEDAQEATFRAAVDQGAIKEVWQRWVSIRDKRRDPICARLHGQRVRMGDRFRDPVTGKTYAKPPAPHGKCRCGRQYSFRKPGVRAAMEFMPDPRMERCQLLPQLRRVAP
jgi:hypothetical protein